MTYQAVLDQLRDRVRELDRVVSGASADRDLAMFRAHQHGASAAEIARWVCADPDRVTQIIDELGREDDVDEWDDGGWLRYCVHRQLAMQFVGVDRATSRNVSLCLANLVQDTRGGQQSEGLLQRLSGCGLHEESRYAIAAMLPSSK